MMARGGSRIKSNPLNPAPRSTLTLTGEPKKRSKYGNEKTIVDGIEFDSKKEATRYVELKTLVRAGEIRELELQVEFHLLSTPFKMSYFADFTYLERRRRGYDQWFWQFVCEDVKSEGTLTREYRRKRKAMKTIFGIVIRET